jgi:hypothetical protein
MDYEGVVTRIVPVRETYKIDRTGHRQKAAKIISAICCLMRIFLRDFAAYCNIIRDQDCYNFLINCL